MSRQNLTGIETEELVALEISKMGLIAHKPMPDRGIDLIVTSAEKPGKSIKIQIKGRGPIQTNQRFRWFQIRTTSKQREETVYEGLPVNESWRKKVAKADLFILVSQKYNEFWVFEPQDMESLIKICSLKYGNRKDNQEGLQSEVDLDVEFNGKTLKDIYRSHLGNWQLLEKLLSG